VGIVRNVAYGSLQQSVPSAVISDDGRRTGESLVPASNLGILPLHLDVAERDERAMDQGWALTDGPVSDPHTI
jgi:hypothetical protein